MKVRRTSGKFLGSDSEHAFTMPGGRRRKVKNHELVVGKLATMISVHRDEFATVLFAVIETAVRDIAGATPAAAFDDDEFTYNLAEARAFLFGHRGGIYFDALGMDADLARSVIRKHLGPELDAVDRIPEPPVERATLAERIAARVTDALARGANCVDEIAFKVGSTRGNTLAALRLLVNQRRVVLEPERRPKGGGRGGIRTIYRLAEIQEAA